MSDPFAVYNIVMGVFAGAGLLYLLYLERVVVRYRTFLLIVTAGLVTFSVIGPAVELLAPDWVHLVHGLAALLVIVGLYEPVHHNIRTRGAVTMLVTDPRSMRLPPNWMSPMDDDILELFHSVDLVLSPAIIAYNLDYSREAVNRHLSELEDHDIVERIERGKYRITRRGERYLQGRFEETVVGASSDDIPADEQLSS